MQGSSGPRPVRHARQQHPEPAMEALELGSFVRGSLGQCTSPAFFFVFLYDDDWQMVSRKLFSLLTFVLINLFLCLRHGTHMTKTCKWLK